MIDLHTHTTFSDGELIPSELVRRAQVMGYKAIGLTDHVDFTNIEFVLNNIFKVKYLEPVLNMKILVGVELTHVPPQKISQITGLARDLGAEIIIVHGETPVEPVMPTMMRRFCPCVSIAPSHLRWRRAFLPTPLFHVQFSNRCPNLW